MGFECIHHGSGIFPWPQDALTEVFSFSTFVCFFPFVRMLSNIMTFWNAKRFLKIEKLFDSI